MYYTPNLCLGWQVRRCIGETFGLLRRGDMEHAFRCALGVVPHGRWQALLGRTDTGNVAAMDAGALSSDFSRLDTSGTLRSSVRLSQFREKGVHLSDEWRKRTRSHHMRRREASTIELTRAERAATAGQFGTAAWQRGRGRGRAALPALAASLAEVSNGVDDTLSSSVGRVDRLGAAAANMKTLGRLLPPHADETGEVLSFFLEVGINGSLDVEHTVIAASLPTAGRARGCLRPVVAETYTLFPCQPQPQPQNSSPCGSLEAALALLPSESEPAAAPPLAVGAKRAASYLDAGDLEGTNGRTSGDQDLGQEQELEQEQDRVRSSKLQAAAATSTVGSALEAAEAQLHRAVQMYHRLVPFARLQHALLKVGTGLSLDFRELTHFSGGATQQQVPRCAVFLAGEHGWSRPEVAATSARVSFFAGHTQTDTWEWEVSLGPTSALMDYTAGVASKGEGAEAAATRELVHKQLPLVKHLKIGVFNGLSSQDYVGGMVGGKQVQFRFPPPFSVHAMCRSFGLAGEGLAAMQTLAAQASTLQHRRQQQHQQDGGVGGYRVVSYSPVHVAMRDSELDHVVVLTHSAFSARHISSAERPGLVLISLPSVPTCPVAMRELEASVRKHRDLNALLHGLSRTIAALAVVSRVVPGVGSAIGVGGDRFCEGGGRFVLAAVSPARFVLSEAVGKTRSPLTLMVEGAGQVRVSRVGQKDVVADTGVLRDLLLEWIASYP